MRDEIKRALEILRAGGAGELVRALRRRVLLDVIELIKSPLDVDSDGDPYHRLFGSFFQQVNTLLAPRVLELGARARSGNVYRTLLKPDARYTGFDLLAGENVDVVGDAHELSTIFPPGSFDVVYSVSLFEHLAMPWKVVLEINRVLRPGGLVFVATHPALPPHELPWDFWRFNRAAFKSLFCAATGFQLLDCEEGLPCIIVPLASDAALAGTIRHRAFVAIAALARKTAEPDSRLSWPVSISGILDEPYPED
ncbi:MAG TPA: class I SAM-dependent methyltransferase [Myxococcales bacterium]|jgi:SAM-dependent methyltransferase|nr:class I SAM-dependent methyltransferase [Myxococcales bacterium]